MSNLISELDQNPDMQKEFEKMMQELISAGGVPNPEEAAQRSGPASTPAAAGTSSTTKPAASSSSSSTKKSGAPEDKFQDTIRRTMERMQASGDAATAASTSTQSKSSEDALLEQMMASLMEGNGEGGEGDFNSMLMSMMTQLTHKEILYEPMKELHDKFPGWMEKNASTTAKDDLARFQKQQKLVGEIVGRFERSGYSDDNDADREYIVERMQEMQSAGSPPEDLVGDMAAAQEALGDLDSSCPTQ
jgi:peroxin-19